ncbi:class I SAM-dependent rRNA methyltransferase [Calycomorphotria hydatis]|uniref:Ribosomal RNA large subunit methyltransferase I n=1 Tax=Calycomorphotria hydatis TaxID=2528027 RepID=A0A517TC20_9PLAN|nr:class I SAM-dependent rRNA methyltransferase [Calycomorphotria hydatis]QDT65927.1 Ribosomal RNA large subunit methyltransferase I [Calycomorphotria hydatis]
MNTDELHPTNPVSTDISTTGAAVEGSPTNENSPSVVRLKKRKAQPFHFRHPWVFEGAIAKVTGEPVLGSEAILTDDAGKPIARGLWNPNSNLRLRLYTWNTDTPLDRAFWSVQLDMAIAYRRALFSEWDASNACRLVFSEADGFSGLIVDRFGDWLVIQLTAGVLVPHLETITELLVEKLSPRGIRLRTERGIGETEGVELTDRLLFGEEPPRPLFLNEHGVQYGTDLAEGQKTGFYLDQRDNRAAVARYASKGEMLDVCCYSGGFGLTAVKQGLVEKVTAVDVSASALALARANTEMNGVAEKFEFIESEAYPALEKLAEEGRTFETIVLDPPKMTRHRRGIEKALRGYYQMNQLAVQLLKPGGLLATCSCSGLITRDDFLHMLASVAMRTGRPLRILESRGPAPDHPVSPAIPETDYLQCVICRVE